MKKRSLAAVLGATALVAAIGIGSTFAYFTDTDGIANSLSTGHIDIDIYESQDEEDDGLEFSDLVPGQTVEKDPTVVVEEGSQDALIRVKVDITSEDGTISSDALDDIVLDINDGWTLGSDGYYYYGDGDGEALSAGDTATLFNTVTIPASWTNSEADGNFEIELTAEAIQAENLANGVVANGIWNLNQNIEVYSARTTDVVEE
ncbi:MAG: M73 family metallopeptidase [Eubacterium sp.]|nr:M73 family metallopeptidase [Eubacterium sp.]